MAAFAALAAGCGTAAAGGADGPAATTSSTTAGMTSTSTTAPAEDPDTVVEVALTDYEFVGLPDTLDAGLVRFEAVNRGPSDHELEVLDADGEALGEIEAMPPGDSGSLEVDLEPGRYTVQCILPVGDGTDDTHADRGMIDELEVE